MLNLLLITLKTYIFFFFLLIQLTTAVSSYLFS